MSQGSSFEPPVGGFTLEDQAFLKELGISVLPKGLEFVLQQQRAAQDHQAKIDARATGLQSLHLDQATLEKLAIQKGISVEKVREELGFFRDLDKLQDPEV